MVCHCLRHSAIRRTHKSMCRIAADEFHAIKRWRFGDGHVKRNERLKSKWNGKHGRQMVAISILPLFFWAIDGTHAQADCCDWWSVDRSELLADVTISREEFSLFFSRISVNARCDCRNNRYRLLHCTSVFQLNYSPLRFAAVSSYLMLRRLTLLFILRVILNFFHAI